MVLTLHTVWNSFKWRTQYYTTLYRSSLESKIPGQIEKIFEKKKKLNMFEKNGWWEVGGKGRRRLKRWMEVGIGAWEREREKGWGPESRWWAGNHVALSEDPNVGLNVGVGRHWFYAFAIRVCLLFLRLPFTSDLALRCHSPSHTLLLLLFNPSLSPLVINFFSTQLHSFNLIRKIFVICFCWNGRTGWEEIGGDWDSCVSSLSSFFFFFPFSQRIWMMFDEWWVWWPTKAWDQLSQKPTKVLCYNPPPKILYKSKYSRSLSLSPPLCSASAFSLPLSEYVSNQKLQKSALNL